MPFIIIPLPKPVRDKLCEKHFLMGISCVFTVGLKMTCQKVNQITSLGLELPRLSFFNREEATANPFLHFHRMEYHQGHRA